jgi:hypothetical protein
MLTYFWINITIRRKDEGGVVRAVLKHEIKIVLIVKRCINCSKFNNFNYTCKI